MKTKTPQSYQRFNHWKAAAAITYEQNKTTSMIFQINMSLHFPITEKEWDEVEALIRSSRPNSLVGLLALTPYEPDDAKDN